MMWNRGPISFFWMWKFSCTNTIVEDCSFPFWVDLASLSKVKAALDVCVYFWTFSSIPLVFMSTRKPLSKCFGHCSFIVSFEIENLSPLTVFFSRLFWLFGALCLSIWIWGISFSISAKKAVVILRGIALNL